MRCFVQTEDSVYSQGSGRALPENSLYHPKMGVWAIGGWGQAPPPPGACLYSQTSEEGLWVDGTVKAPLCLMAK